MENKFMHLFVLIIVTFRLFTNSVLTFSLFIIIGEMVIISQNYTAHKSQEQRPKNHFEYLALWFLALMEESRTIYDCNLL